MSNHTPGPWKAEEGSTVRDKNGFVVARLGSLIFRRGPEKSMASEVHANGQLIASAPDLLSALEELLSEYEDHRAQFGEDVLWQKFERVEVIDQARTAIKKARGETE